MPERIRPAHSTHPLETEGLIMTFKTLLGAGAATVFVAAAAFAQDDARPAGEQTAETVESADETTDEVVVRGIRIEPVYWERYKPVPLQYQGPAMRSDGEVERASTEVGGASFGLVADYGAQPADAASPSDTMSVLDEDNTALNVTVRPAPEGQ